MSYLRPPRRRERSRFFDIDLELELDEKGWQADVMATAERCGWQLRYHTFDSRRSTAGFPDLVLVRAPRVIFAELKRNDQRPTAEQWRWINELGDCDGVEAYIWCPDDRATVDRILSQRNRP
jgi:hypothetical protein